MVQLAEGIDPVADRIAIDICDLSPRSKGLCVIRQTDLLPLSLPLDVGAKSGMDTGGESLCVVGLSLMLKGVSAQASEFYS